jgi:cyclic lactone autoinducer peptide
LEIRRSLLGLVKTSELFYIRIIKEFQTIRHQKRPIRHKPIDIKNTYGIVRVKLQSLIKNQNIFNYKIKRSEHMFKSKLFSVVASFALLIAATSVNTCSALFYYQPEMPEDM